MQPLASSSHHFMFKIAQNSVIWGWEEQKMVNFRVTWFVDGQHVHCMHVLENLRLMICIPATMCLSYFPICLNITIVQSLKLSNLLKITEFHWPNPLEIVLETFFQEIMETNNCFHWFVMCMKVCHKKYSYFPNKRLETLIKITFPA